MVTPAGPDRGRTHMRPRFPALLTQETLEQSLSDTSWRHEAPAHLRGQLATIANRMLIHYLERFGGAGTVRLESALAARELMLAFVEAAPRALDDGAPAAVWAAAFAGTITACQWADIPMLIMRDGVGFDRGLEEDLFDDDSDDEADDPIDLASAEIPIWSDLVTECATETAVALGALVCDVLDRASIIRSTLAIFDSTERWRVPSYRTYMRQGVIRTAVPLSARPPNAA